MKAETPSNGLEREREKERENTGRSRASPKKREERAHHRKWKSERGLFGKGAPIQKKSQHIKNKKMAKNTALIT